MAHVRVVAAENTISRTRNGTRQILNFWLQIDNQAYHKRVDVCWSGEEGQWHWLPARFQYQQADGREYWKASLVVSGRSGRRLPGPVRFAVRLSLNEFEHWDNNNGLDHQLPTGIGVRLFGNVPLHHLLLAQELSEGQHYLPIQLAIDVSLQATQVEIHWTSDNWRHRTQIRCHRRRSPLKANSQIWSTRLDVSKAFAIEYCVCIHGRAGVLWDNNGGQNFRLARRPLSLMILNLHCYQEAEQSRKFRQIAKAIDDHAVDVVCFQEVAENWNDGHGDWASNSANLINQQLKNPMHLHWDWSHLGFDRYREGVAILSRHPLHHGQARYVSDSHDAYSIHSRKVVMAQIDLAYFGKLNVFSAHLSWWEDGFSQQFRRLSEWAASVQGEATTLLCGDFNIAAGSIGYQQVVSDGQYEDQYLAVNHQGLFEQIFRVNDAHWRDLLSDDYRIDYVFMNKQASLRARTAKVLFTDQDYGSVSDHCGYLLTFEPLLY